MRIGFLKASGNKAMEPPIKASAELLARHAEEPYAGWNAKMGWLKDIMDRAGKRGVDFNELSPSYKQRGHALEDSGYASTKIVADRRAFVSRRPNPFIQFLTAGIYN